MECQQRQQAEYYAHQRANEILDGIESVVEKSLARLGLSKREIRADWGKVPRLMKDAMPRDVLKDLSAGTVPARGFGLGSETGRGKTMAIAAIMRGFERARWQKFAGTLPEKAKAKPEAHHELRQAAVWLCWPDTVATLRAHAIDGEAEAILECAEVAPLLILDDLGRERIKGSYLEDWAANQLDRLVNHRYREELPTIWTTNLLEAQLIPIYGAALVSRLTEDNPLAWVDGLPSQRIR